MEVTIDGERTKLPDDDDLTLAELEEVAKHLKIDMGTGLSQEKFMGQIFIAVRRKNPDGAAVDQVDAVRKMTIKQLEIEEEEEDVPAVPLAVDAAANGHSETTHERSGVPA